MKIDLFGHYHNEKMWQEQRQALLHNNTQPPFTQGGGSMRFLGQFRQAELRN